MRADRFFVTPQAVADGFGLGIGPFPVLDGDVAAGRIVTPFPDIVVPRTGYVELIPFDAEKSRLLDWLIERGGQAEPGSDKAGPPA